MKLLLLFSTFLALASLALSWDVDVNLKVVFDCTNFYCKPGGQCDEDFTIDPADSECACNCYKTHLQCDGFSFEAYPLVRICQEVDF